MNNIKKIILHFFSYKQIILLGIVGILAGIAGFFYAKLSKPEYESKVTFSLDAGSNEGGLTGAMNLAAQFGFGIGGSQNMFDGDNILVILKSRRIIERVLLSSDTFDKKPSTLIDFFLLQSGMKAKMENKPRTKGISFPVNSVRDKLNYVQDSILYSVYNSFAENFITAGRPDKKLSIYEVKIKSMDERFSKIFTDRLIDVTSSYYTEITSKKDKETLEILEQRVAALKSNVNTSIDIKASGQDANVNPAFAAAQSQATKQQYNMQAYGEAYKEMFKTLEMARYQYLKKIPLLQIIDGAHYPMKKIKPGKLKFALYFASIAVLIVMCVLVVTKKTENP